MGNSSSHNYDLSKWSEPIAKFITDYITSRNDPTGNKYYPVIEFNEALLALNKLDPSLQKLIINSAIEVKLTDTLQMLNHMNANNFFFELRDILTTLKEVNNLEINSIKMKTKMAEQKKIHEILVKVEFKNNNMSIIYSLQKNT